MALEDLIREAASRGITHLSLSPTPSEDGRTIYWAARATPSTEHKYISCNTLDPVDAITQVLLALPKAPKRAPRTKNGERPISVPVAELPEAPVTAAVTRETFTVPEGHVATRDGDGRATGETTPINLDDEFSSWLPKP